VFVRSRSGSSKAPRFSRVTGLQRVVAVRANDTGSLAALCQTYRPPIVTPLGNTFTEDLARLRPWTAFTPAVQEGLRLEPKLGSSLMSQVPQTSSHIKACEGDKSDSGGDTETLIDLPRSTPRFSVTHTKRERLGPEEKLGRSWTIPATDIPSIRTELEDEDEADSDAEAEALALDSQEICRLWDVLAQSRTARRRGSLGHGVSVISKLPNGADLVLRVQGSADFPVHRTLLSARCVPLARVLGGFGSLYDRESGISLKLHPAPNPQSGAGPPRTAGEAPRLAIGGVDAFSVLVLVHYLYTDLLLAVGDPRLARSTAEAFTGGRISSSLVVRDLRTLARVLHLGYLADALRGTVRCEPLPFLSADFSAIFDAPMSVTPPDVVVQLADRDVLSHSFVLRARSPFFEDFFAGADWTAERWETDGTLRVDLRHLEWRSMQYVLRFMCCGEEAEMFERLGTCPSSLDSFTD
jgi:hypothetical protein